jgi:aminoglycoside phosphotransferase (APT) family kinase protein
MPFGLREQALTAIDHLVAFESVMPAELFGKPVRFIALPGRNRNLLVEGLDRPIVFKEHTPTLSGPAGLGEREAAFYEFINQDRGRNMPVCALIAADRFSGRIAIEAVRDALPASLLLGEGRLDRNKARSMGDAIGRVHAATFLTREEWKADCVRPAYWSFDLPDVWQNRSVSASAQDRVTALTAAETVQRLLVIAKAADNRDVLIHADLRLSNILLDARQVKLVDWESFGWGAAAVDLGAFLGSIWYSLWRSRASGTAWTLEGKRLLDASLEGYQTNKRWESDCGINAALSFLQYAIEDAGRDKLSAASQQVIETAMLLKAHIDDATP